MEPIDNILVLQGEDGNVEEFEFLDLITYRSKEYVVLLPHDDTADEVVILQLDEMSDDRKSYSAVEDDDILWAVFEIFKENYKDQFDFVD